MNISRTLPGRVVAERAGVTYRQLDYWHRAGLYPDVPGGTGSGRSRLWAPRHVAVTALWAALHRLGAGYYTCQPMAGWAAELTGPWEGLLVVAPPEQNPRNGYRQQLLLPEADWTLTDGLTDLDVGGAWVVDLGWCWEHAQLGERLHAVS